MSRCFPFPPPGYENKPKAENLDLLTKVPPLAFIHYIFSATFMRSVILAARFYLELQSLVLVF